MTKTGQHSEKRGPGFYPDRIGASPLGGPTRDSAETFRLVRGAIAGADEAIREAQWRNAVRHRGADLDPLLAKFYEAENVDVGERWTWSTIMGRYDARYRPEPSLRTEIAVTAGAFLLAILVGAHVYGYDAALWEWLHFNVWVLGVERHWEMLWRAWPW